MKRHKSTWLTTVCLSPPALSSAQGNPCLAWQVVGGKCRILRQDWFDRFTSAGLGVTPPGNLAMSPQEAILACSGVSDSTACARADGSEGDWSSCCDSAAAGSCSAAEDCTYDSFLYYRSSAANTSVTALNATFRRLLTVGVPANGGIPQAGYNLSLNVTAFADRARLHLLLANGTAGAQLAKAAKIKGKGNAKGNANGNGNANSNANNGNANSNANGNGNGNANGNANGNGATEPSQPPPWPPLSPPGTPPIAALELAIGEGRAVGSENCAVVELLSSLVLDETLSSANSSVIDEDSDFLRRPICRSEPLCEAEGQLVLNCSQAAIQEAVDEIRTRRRRRLFLFDSSTAAETTQAESLILSFNADGSGDDVRGLSPCASLALRPLGRPDP